MATKKTPKKTSRVKRNPTAKKYLWEGVKEGRLCWHIHHEILCEMATEPLEQRAKFIKYHKELGERELRLRLMRPVKNQRRLIEDLATIQFSDDSWARREARAHIYEQHQEECPDCPWDGTTIFPKKEE